MEFPLLDKIARQVPKGTLVQTHLNGDPSHYPRLGDALKTLSHCITAFNTHGLLLAERADELIGNIDSITVSVIHGDTPENYKRQQQNISEFLKRRGDMRPRIMVLRFLGDVDQEPWRHLGLLHATRILHSPDGSFDYERQVTIAETGLCQDLINSVAIDRFGKVALCARFDPDGLGIIGDLNRASLEEIVNGINSQPWHNHTRRRYIEMHLDGRRNEVPLCALCHFYGCATPYTGRKLHEQQRRITGDISSNAQSGTERVVQRRKRGTSDHPPRWLPVGRT